MTMSIEKFREARAARGKGPYPKGARTWACRYAQEQLESGRLAPAIAADLGVDPMTLKAWLYGVTSKTTPRGQVREVVVEPSREPLPARSTKAFTVTTAQGHTVGGLDLESAAALLKALG